MAFFEGFDVNGSIVKENVISGQRKTTENIESEDDTEEIEIIENPMESEPTTEENPSINPSQSILTPEAVSNNTTLPVNQQIVDITNQNNQIVTPSNVNQPPDFKDV